MARFKELLKVAKRYEQVTQLRNYIKAVELNAQKSNLVNRELKGWLKWAMDKADWYDPIIGEEDELLGDYI